MSYSLDHIAAALKAARESKGLTQRQLKDLAGLPQGHISRIENGSVDLKLSTLIELARILDLEVMLIPRSKVPAAQTIARTDEDPSRIRPVIEQIRLMLHEQYRDNPASLRDWAESDRTLWLLLNHRLKNDERNELKSLVNYLKHAREKPDRPERLKHFETWLRELRNRVVHEEAPELPLRPAYSLDEEDDDA